MPSTADAKGEGVLCLVSVSSRSKTPVVLPFSTHARNNATTYALLKDAPTAIIYVDAVIAIKFTMSQAKHEVKGYKTFYKVPKEVHEHILGEVSLFNA